MELINSLGMDCSCSLLCSRLEKYRKSTVATDRIEIFIVKMVVITLKRIVRIRMKEEG